jgi:hypothetical protein
MWSKDFILEFSSVQLAVIFGRFRKILCISLRLVCDNFTQIELAYCFSQHFGANVLLLALKHIFKFDNVLLLHLIGCGCNTLCSHLV